MEKTIGRNLCKMREANRFTQTQVADYLGISRSTYSMYELGEREMSLEMMERVADLMGCELATLFEENENAVNNMLTCAFRMEDLNVEDMQEIAAFKAIVMSYMKMNQLATQ